MNTDMDIVEIDRILLEGLDVTAVRGNELRVLVEKSLQRRLEETRALNGLSGSEASVLSVSDMNADTDQSDQQLADGLARHVARAIQDMG